MINVREFIEEIPAEDSIIQNKVDPCLKSAIKRYEFVRKEKAMLEYEINQTDTHNLPDDCQRAYIELAASLRKVLEAESRIIKKLMQSYDRSL